MASAAEVTSGSQRWPPLFDEFTSHTKQDYKEKYRVEFTDHDNDPFKYPNFVLLRILVVLNTIMSKETFKDYVIHVAREMIKPEIFVGDGSDTRIFPIHDDDLERETIIIPRLTHFCSVLTYEIKQLFLQSRIVGAVKKSNLTQNIQSFFSLVVNKYRDKYDDDEKNSQYDKSFKDSLDTLRNIVENPTVKVTVVPFSIRKVKINSERLGTQHNADQLPPLPPQTPCRYGIYCRLMGNPEHTQRFSHPVPEEVDGGGRKRRTKTNKRNRHSVSFKSKRNRTRNRTRSYRRN